MTAYQLTPVGAEGVEPERSVRLDMLSMSELLAENERLRRRLDEETDLRFSFQERLSKASRVLASLGRHSPQMADLVEVARREVYGRLP